MTETDMASIEERAAEGWTYSNGPEQAITQARKDVAALLIEARKHAALVKSFELPVAAEMAAPVMVTAAPPASDEPTKDDEASMAAEEPAKPKAKRPR